MQVTFHWREIARDVWLRWERVLRDTRRKSRAIWKTALVQFEFDFYTVHITFFVMYMIILSRYYPLPFLLIVQRVKL